jgi:predicted ATPase
VILVSGEPGIGKTRCAEALAEVAEDQGALVLWGRCYEEAGAPPYWPWVQILRAYVEASSLDEVRLTMGTAANDIAALVPELMDVSHRTLQPSGAIGDANAARFRTFDAIRQFFHQATQQVPITLVLDNLHWADAPSLALLEFLSQELLRSRLLIVGTYRDAETAARTPLHTALGGLGRDTEVQRIHLTGLSKNAIAEVAQRLCQVSLSETTLKMIYQRTDGNPLFAIELIKVLIDESADAGIGDTPLRIPAGVHETIGRRLIRLSDVCNELLCVAAVRGRQFTAREIAAPRERRSMACRFNCWWTMRSTWPAAVVTRPRAAPAMYSRSWRCVVIRAACGAGSCSGRNTSPWPAPSIAPSWPRKPITGRP